MYQGSQFNLLDPETLTRVLPFFILDLVLRGFALWKAARKGQNIWFIALMVVNSVGILPAIYLLINRDTEEAPKKAKSKPAPRKKR